MSRYIPFTSEEISMLTKTYQTPFYIYDESAIRNNVRRFYKAFSWVKGFTNFFAVKANPNPHILQLLKEEGMGVDCSSMAELVLAERVGFSGHEIMFTSNNTPIEEYKKALELGAIINLDDITHLFYLEEYAGLPNFLCFRYNPGALKKNANAIIGTPQEAKYGMTKDQIMEAISYATSKGVRRFGLHTMVVSNELKVEHLLETARIMFHLVQEVYLKTGVKIEFLDLGGGIGIPYRPQESPVDLEYFSETLHALYDKEILGKGVSHLRLTFECGRMVLGPYGYLVTKAIHRKHTYKEYVGVDACMANLMRPGMYGAYHEVSVLGKDKDTPLIKYDVVGSLCENNDKFAIDRVLPPIEVGDILVIHDAGAHGYAMGFNYNGKLKCAELLQEEKGTYRLIRRAETLDDYFATLVDF